MELTVLQSICTISGVQFSIFIFEYDGFFPVLIFTLLLYSIFLEYIGYTWIYSKPLFPIRIR